MLVTKCSRLLRLGSRPSVKLSKVVIGICPSLVDRRWSCQSPLRTVGHTTSGFPEHKREWPLSRAEGWGKPAHRSTAHERSLTRHKLPRQVDSSKLDCSPSNRSRYCAGGRLPSASCGGSRC